MKMSSGTIHTFILRRKKLLCCFSILLFIVLLFYRTGVFTLSKNYYIRYYERNENDFLSIVDYVKTEGFIDINGFSQALQMKDCNAKSAIVKMMLLGVFNNIYGYDEYIIFQCNNLFESKGTSIAIVYSLKHSEKKWSDLTWGSGDSYIRYGYTYEKIAENWYYKYKSH